MMHRGLGPDPVVSRPREHGQSQVPGNGGPLPGTVLDTGA